MSKCIVVFSLVMLLASAIGFANRSAAETAQTPETATMQQETDCLKRELEEVRARSKYHSAASFFWSTLAQALIESPKPVTRQDVHNAVDGKEIVDALLKAGMSDFEGAILHRRWTDAITAKVEWREYTEGSKQPPVSCK